MEPAGEGQNGDQSRTTDHNWDEHIKAPEGVRRGGPVLTMLDLFSGIGGFSLAASWTGGIKAVMFCEIEPYCQKVLKKHWPDVPIHDDIRTLRGEDVGTVAIVCGGFPCQPFSVAGKRRGKEDDRYLWPEMFRIIQETKPTWVLGENVTGLIDLALDTVLSDLESEGYETAAFVIPACAVGAPHRRDRVWVVAYSAGLERKSRAEKQGVLRGVSADGGKCDNAGRPGETQSWQDVGYPYSLRMERPRAKQQTTRFSRTSQNVAYSAGTRLEGEVNQTRQIARRSKGSFEPRLGRVLDGLSDWLDGHRWPAPFGCEQYDWEPPRLVQGKIPHRRQQLMALGDAVVPQVAYEIFRAIVEVERRRKAEM